jgi:hypothetical protein
MIGFLGPIFLVRTYGAGEGEIKGFVFLVLRSDCIVLDNSVISG